MRVHPGFSLALPDSGGNPGAHPGSQWGVGSAWLTCLAAFTIPLAMTSHFMMPPKMFTRTALTEESEVRILNASTTCAPAPRGDPATPDAITGEKRPARLREFVV